MAFEVSSYPCMSKIDDSLGFNNSGYSAGFNNYQCEGMGWNGYHPQQQAGDYNYSTDGGLDPSWGDNNCQGFLELWKFVQPYKFMVPMPAAAGYDSELGYSYGGYYVKPKFITQEQQQQANGFSPSNGRPPDKYSRSFASDPPRNILSVVGLSDEDLMFLAQSNQFLKEGVLYCMPQNNVHHQCFAEDSCVNNKPVAAAAPHDGLFFVLQYLELQELLCVEQVCKSLHDWIRSDTSLWQNLKVVHPLNAKLTDDALTSLSARARGYLKSLDISDCSMVSGGALHEVLVTNLMLTKLRLPGCKKITANSLVEMLQRYFEMGGRKLQQLWIRGLHDITRDHLKTLEEALVPVGKLGAELVVKLQLYHGGYYSISCNIDHDRRMDVEACPRCSNPRMVFDCTREKCRQRETQGLGRCRGCISCIARCEGCGTCLEDDEYLESFNLDLICSKCLPSPGVMLLQSSQSQSQSESQVGTTTTGGDHKVCGRKQQQIFGGLSSSNNNRDCFAEEEQRRRQQEQRFFR